MKDVNIAFIGGGNMATSLIGGLLADHVSPARLCVADRDPAQREHLAAQFGVRTSEDNAACAEDADVIVLAVKPQVLHEVCEALTDSVQRKQPLVVSVAAGVRTDSLRRWLGGGDVAIVRAMPNTPALLQSGATGLYACTGVSEEQRDLAEAILRATGLTLWVDDEAQMDIVTALSGSGPAYFFRVMEGLEKAATELGLPAQTARLLTLQTALGAARMALESSEPVATLRKRVTSPGGTTEQGLKAMEAGDIDALLGKVLKAARDRSRELAKLLDDT
ncbi:MAG TPA: pyrroline-5-carboxylate reductase [Chromatiales bacterium]|nr:pyrroline-5-carboxylate reductase [Chromatiales bacterium]HEX22088.1 pyrroline-5-carboxylate reductase [Chromatiales bacterium]